MADPRKNLVSTEKQNRLQSNKRTTFNKSSNLGKAENLTQAGYGDVKQGLEVAAAVSDTIRSGNSIIPTNETQEAYNTLLSRISSTDSADVETGANTILDAIGIGRNIVDAVNNIDANTANTALGRAKTVFQQVKSGDFSLRDIPGTFKDLQNLEVISRRVFTPTAIGSSLVNILNKSLSRPSPWAVDLISKAPRSKFLYIVDIKFAPAYQAWNEQLANGLAFITKSSTRPQVDFEYDEVNMYNYWTRVPKRTIFNPMTMRFIDDNTNNALNFYAAYMRAMSPITNKKFIDERSSGRGSGGHATTGVYENDSMRYNFTGDDQQLFDVNLPAYSASIGTLNNDVNGNPTKSLLSNITLYHVGNYGDSITAFHMFNPKITSLQPDDVDMADNGDGSEFTFEFTYDSLFVDPSIPMSTFGSERIEQVSGERVGAKYSLNPITTPTGSLGGNNSGVSVSALIGATQEPGE